MPLIIGIIVIALIVYAIGYAVGGVLVTIYWIPANLILLFEESLSISNAIPPLIVWGGLGLLIGLIVAGLKEAPYYGHEGVKPMLVGIPVMIFFIIGLVNISSVDRKITPERDQKKLKLLNAKFKLESGTTYPIRSQKTIKLQRPGFYSFDNISGYSVTTYPLLINFGEFSITTNKFRVYDNPVYIDKPYTVTMRYKSSYVQNLTSKTHLKELMDVPKEFGIFLFPDRHNNYLLNFTKGMWYELDKPEELIRLDFYKNDNKIDGVTFPPKHDKRSSEFTCDSPSDKDIVYCWSRNNIYLYFWSDYTVKFKSAEVPYLLTLKGQPSYEKLKINSEEIELAHYMYNQEVVTTKVWLDEGDTVTVYSGQFYLSTENESWKSEKNYRCAKAGFLRVKAIGKVRLNNIKIKRDKKWKFSLKPNQSYEKIKVYPGDSISIYSNARYYLNGNIQERGTFTWNFSNEQILDFKGSVQEAKIEVKTIKRRGI